MGSFAHFFALLKDCCEGCLLDPWLLFHCCCQINLVTLFGAHHQKHQQMSYREGGGDAENAGGGRSTRGASKQRREQINNELSNLRHLLPLDESIRERLFQLQVMSLSCISIRKAKFFPMTFPSSHNELEEIKQEAAADKKYILSYTMAMHDNFLLVTIGEEAKLLAISENFTTTPELISTEEWMAQSDSLFDLIDPRDHSALARALAIVNDQQKEGEIRAFACRWRAPKLGGVTKRQPDWDGKPTLVEGTLKFAAYNGGQKTFLFLGWCRPLLTNFDKLECQKRPICQHQQQVNAPSMDSNNQLLLLPASIHPNIFRFSFSLDLRILAICSNAKNQLEFLHPWTQKNPQNSEEREPVPSLYHFLHPSSTHILAKINCNLLDNGPSSLVAENSIESALLTVVNPTDCSSQHFHAIFRRIEKDKIEAAFQQLSNIEADALANTEWLYNSINLNNKSVPNEREEAEEKGKEEEEVVKVTTNGTTTITRTTMERRRRLTKGRAKEGVWTKRKRAIDGRQSRAGQRSQPKLLKSQHSICSQNTFWTTTTAAGTSSLGGGTGAAAAAAVHVNLPPPAKTTSAIDGNSSSNYISSLLPTIMPNNILDHYQCHQSDIINKQPDLNNNNLLMTNGFGGCWPEDTSTLFEELPSLPELDDRDLDEFFRQVEQRGGEGPMGTEDTERIMAAKKADEQEEELERDGKKRKETKGPEGIRQ